jgi:hypothetical protein
MLMVEGYFDESGDLDDAPGIFCVSGYFVETEAAKRMDAEWCEVLEKYQLGFFHMVDCAHGNEGFEVRTAWSLTFMDASGKRRRRQFEPKSEADYFRIGAEGQLRTGTFRPDAAKQTVKAVAELYKNHLVGREQRKKGDTPTS